MYTKNLLRQVDGTNKSQKRRSAVWLITFADMATLLMTFFILLLTFATIDLQRFKSMLDAIRETLGPNTTVTSSLNKAKPTEDYRLAKDNSRIKTTSLERQIEKSTMEYQMEKTFINIIKFVKDNHLEDTIHITKGRKGIRLNIIDNLLFDSGIAELKQEAIPFLDKISNILLTNTNYFLIVEGHTDNTPITSTIYPSNWELSGARASSVIRYLINNNVSQERLAGIGLSSNFPIAPNDNPENRTKNRRVELIITNTSPRIIIEE